jgi:hypothetical protein
MHYQYAYRFPYYYTRYRQLLLSRWATSLVPTINSFVRFHLFVFPVPTFLDSNRSWEALSFPIQSVIFKIAETNKGQTGSHWQVSDGHSKGLVTTKS